MEWRWWGRVGEEIQEGTEICATTAKVPDFRLSGENIPVWWLGSAFLPVLKGIGSPPPLNHKNNVGFRPAPAARAAAAAGRRDGGAVCVPAPSGPAAAAAAVPPPLGASFSILVKNIPADVAEHELTEIFRAYGTVLDVYLPKDVYTRGRKSFGFIEFDNQESANEAVDKMHGQMLRNNALICELAKHQRKSRSEMMEQDRRPPPRRQNRSRGPPPSRYGRGGERERDSRRRRSPSPPPRRRRNRSPSQSQQPPQQQQQQRRGDSPRRGSSPGAGSAPGAATGGGGRRSPPPRSRGRLALPRPARHSPSRNATNNVLQELYLQQEQLLKTQTRDKLRAHRARHEQAYGELEAYANQLEWQLQAQFELTQSTLEQCDLDLQANEKEWNEYVNELSLEFDSKLVVMKNEVDLLQDDNVELTRQVASLHSELRRQQWRHQQEMDLLRKQHVQQQDELDRQMQALQQVTAHEQQRKLAQALQDVQL
ncbi:hypothetical protein BASA81_012590 [Batrachochytrium salamandrivorans]|nr:hypothetical protein BASA81_012590 [Batrachochytrium salamandrivorans]